MECRKEFSKVTLSCNQCDKDFSVREFNSDRKYCSADCQYKSMEKEKVPLDCENCGDTFKVKPSVSEKRRFCSYYCNGVGTERDTSTNKKSVTCEICDNSFKVWPYRLDEAKTCSWSCRNKLMSQKMRETDDPDIRKTKEYRDWRKNVLDNYSECQGCGQSDVKLYAHHIVPISENQEKATDLSNGTALCKLCHSKEHPDLSELIKRNPY
jgi:5-methylcytosine-specific restriction endonuclease McrA